MAISISQCLTVCNVGLLFLLNDNRLGLVSEESYVKYAVSSGPFCRIPFRTLFALWSMGDDEDVGYL